MNGHFSLVWLPLHAFEFNDFFIDTYFLVWNLIDFHLLCLKDFNTELIFLLFLELIHYGQVIALWMVKHLQICWILYWMLMKNSSAWHFQEIHSWKDIFTFRERGINQYILVRRPCKVFKSIYKYRCLVSFIVLT